jgi:hypothetical protein
MADAEQNGTSTDTEQSGTDTEQNGGGTVEKTENVRPQSKRINTAQRRVVEPSTNGVPGDAHG